MIESTLNTTMKPGKTLLIITDISKTSGCVKFIFSWPNYYQQRFYPISLSAEQSDSIKVIGSTVNKLSNIVKVIWQPHFPSHLSFGVDVISKQFIPTVAALASDVTWSKLNFSSGFFADSKIKDLEFLLKFPPTDELIVVQPAYKMKNMWQLWRKLQWIAIYHPDSTV